MEHKNYLRKILTELYNADQVFIKTLEKAIKKARRPMPRLKNCIHNLIKDSKGQAKKLEGDIEQVKSQPKAFARARSYQI